MPKRQGGYKKMELLKPAERAALPDGQNAHWYAHIGREFSTRIFTGYSVLDVGAGTGYGREILKAKGARKVDAIDPLPAGEGVVNLPAIVLKPASYDFVIAVDVLEHLEDDRAMIVELARIARFGFAVTVPNYFYERCKNEFHAREYAPSECLELLEGHKRVKWYSARGDKVTLCHNLFDAGFEAYSFGAIVDL
jgi:SAM-dependent methyltransferase